MIEPEELISQLGGQVTIEGILGEGQQATVFAASHRAFGEVAIKAMLVSDDRSGSRKLRRFLREAEFARRVRHPNVLSIFDAGERDGLAYLIMERLCGCDLADELVLRGKFPPAGVAEIAVQVARGITVLDDAGILHRDIKPANLFLHQNGQYSIIKLLDLGVAIARSGKGASRMTVAGNLVGTATYLPPEALELGAPAVLREIYSLGTVLFEMAVGRPPYKTGDFRKALLTKARQPAPRIDSIVPAFPAPLADAIAKCLEPKAENRFQNPTELGSAIQDLQDSLGLPSGAAAF